MDIQNQDNKIANSGFENNQSNIDVFGIKSDHNYLIKKTEKLASATYLVTGLLSDSEPMKWSLRTRVSEIVSYVSKYSDIRQSEYSIFSNSLKSKILEVISLLEVSNLGGLVSNMNFNILKNEFVSLTEIVNTQISKSDTSNNLISNNYFEVKENFPINIQNNLVKTAIPSPVFIKDTLSVKDNQVFKSNNRQNIILGLLKKKRDLTIKDISGIIKDVSEKTIQRELISLINSGIVVKTGERRWSKYSLKTAN